MEINDQYLFGANFETIEIYTTISLPEIEKLVSYTS